MKQAQSASPPAEQPTTAPQVAAATPVPLQASANPVQPSSTPEVCTSIPLLRLMRNKLKEKL